MHSQSSIPQLTPRIRGTLVLTDLKIVPLQRELLHEITEACTEAFTPPFCVAGK